MPPAALLCRPRLASPLRCVTECASLCCAVLRCAVLWLCCAALCGCGCAQASSDSELKQWVNDLKQVIAGARPCETDEKHIPNPDAAPAQASKSPTSASASAASSKPTAAAAAASATAASAATIVFGLQLGATFAVKSEEWKAAAADVTKRSAPLGSAAQSVVQSVWEGEESGVVVDVGSHTARAGWSGDELPRVVLPSLVARPKPQESDELGLGVALPLPPSPSSAAGAGAKQWWAGGEALGRAGVTVKSPLERGVVTNWVRLPTDERAGELSNRLDTSLCSALLWCFDHVT
jgi:hypothetical protein